MKLIHDFLIRTSLTITSLFLISLDVLQAEEFHVSTAVKFQNALTSARDNGQADTIWLAAGTYNASDNSYAFTYITKEGEDFDLTIKGETGTTAEDVILDGNGEYEVLSIDQGNASVTIEGVMIHNGKGGISIYSQDSITLNSNIVLNNIGRGIDVNSHSVTITGNTITNNDCGGGLYFRSYTNATLTNNKIWLCT